MTHRLALLSLSGFFHLAFCLMATGAEASPTFSFDRDTLAFVNDTVFAYSNGHPSLRNDSNERYTARCFVMCRAVVQFQKFARFDPKAAPLDDAVLAERIRAVARCAPWQDEKPEANRIVFPGFPDLRTLSRKNPRVLQANIGQGWPTYFRPGNWRALLPRLPGYQTRTKQRIDQILARGELFVAYITTLPANLNINHAILVTGHRNGNGGDTDYAVYDPTFPKAPRVLSWSAKDGTFSYPPNSTFVGGRVVVWQVYGAPFQ